MTDTQTLARRYRRLLAWYPAAHQQAHGDEMLGVLLAAARPGQRRPGLATTADLVAGALRIRVRALLRAGREIRAAEVLAVLSMLLPLLLSAAGRLTVGIAFLPPPMGALPPWPGPPGLWPFTAGPVLVIAAAAAGLRWVTVLTALTVTVSGAFCAATSDGRLWPPPAEATLWIVLGLLTAAAAAASSDSRHRLLARRWRGAAAGAVLCCLLVWLSRVSYSLMSWRDAVAGLAGLILVTGVCLASATGRRRLGLLAMLAIPVLPYAAGAVGIGPEVGDRMEVLTLFLPPLVLACVTGVALVWARRGPAGQPAKR